MHDLVDDVNAGLRAAAGWRRMPLALTRRNITEAIDPHTAPTPTGRKAGLARSGELEEKRLRSTVPGPDYMGRHKPTVAVVGRDDLLLVGDCFPHD